MNRARGFTLTELLVVLAVITILAAILFPVFRAGRNSANQAVCISNFHQASVSSMLYSTDYDEGFVPSGYHPSEENTSDRDRTWVQILMPYLQSFPIFRCPSDYSDRPDDKATFDQDLIPGDAFSRYFQASQRSNIGYNYLYLSPIVRTINRPYRAISRFNSQIANPSETIVFVDSVWDVSDDGTPHGGGSYLVMPPCRYATHGGTRVDTFLLGGIQDGFIFRAQDYWKVEFRSAAMSYGGTWPWHSGRMTVTFADGRTKPQRVPDLLRGCDASDNWATGNIFDENIYQWDLN